MILEERNKIIDKFKQEINNYNNNEVLKNVKSKIIILENNIKSLKKNLSLLEILKDNNMYNDKKIIQKENL